MALTYLAAGGRGPGWLTGPPAGRPSCSASAVGFDPDHLGDDRAAREGHDPAVAQSRVFLVFAVLMVGLIPLILVVPDHHGQG